MTRRKGWPISGAYNPSAKKIAASKESLRLEVHPLYDDRVDTFMRTFSPADTYSKALFTRIRLQSDGVAQQLVSTNRSDEYGLGELILSSDVLRSALPQLDSPHALDPTFHWAEMSYTGFGLAGDLAEVLGLSPVVRLSDPECMRLASEFVIAITESRYSDFHVLKTYFPWSPFFDDDHDGVPGLGDTTWLIVDGRNGDVSCLFATHS